MKKIMKVPGESRPESSRVWPDLEQYARGEIQRFVQRLLEEEVDDLLGRKKSERRGAGDGAGVSAAGYRNGYGRVRRLALSSGTITVRRPRVRDLEERFASRLLPLAVYPNWTRHFGILSMILKGDRFNGNTSAGFGRSQDLHRRF